MFRVLELGFRALELEAFEIVLFRVCGCRVWGLGFLERFVTEFDECSYDEGFGPKGLGFVLGSPIPNLYTFGVLYRLVIILKFHLLFPWLIGEVSVRVECSISSCYSVSVRLLSGLYKK